MIPLELIVFGLSLLASAFFSAMEISLLSANRLKIQQEAKEGNVGSRLALSLLADRERVLATALAGITIFNLTAAAVATSMLQRWLGNWADWKVSLLTTGGVTLVILIAAEIIPKVYGKQHADRLLETLARPMLATEQLLLPVTAALRAYIYVLLRILRKGARRSLVTREELKVLVHDMSSESGPALKEQKMLRSILDLGETTAREVMVPMTKVVSIEQEAPADLLRALVRRHGFTRMPVFERRVDKVVGLVNIYDLLFDSDPAEGVESYIRPALLVPETKRIDRLMMELQQKRQTMAVVVSEFGSCIGIVTMEDIVEEIVGELAQEHEVGVRKIRQVAPGTFVVDAMTDLDDVNEELGIELPKGRYDTLGGLMLKRFGRIPRDGDWFEVQGVRLEVVDTHPYGVRTIKLVLPQA